MSAPTPDPARDERLTAYLLGVLDADEAAAVEEAAFADGTDYDALRIAEDELIDAYVRDELPAAQRARFEARLDEVADWPRRVAFARRLAAEAGDAQPARANQAGLLARLTRWLTLPRLATLGAVAAAVLLAVALPNVLGGGAPTTALTLVPTTRSDPSALARVGLHDDLRTVELTLAIDRAEPATTVVIDVLRGSDTAHRAAALQRGADGAVTLVVPATALDVGVYTVRVRAADAGPGALPIAVFAFRCDAD